MTRKRGGPPVDENQLSLFGVEPAKPLPPPPAKKEERDERQGVLLALTPTTSRPALHVVPDEPPPPPASPLPAPVVVAPQPDGASLDDALRLERNLALLAGAGAGKTHSLVTMCLHLLSGARADREPLPPSQLTLLTFTEKAADEMRGRLRERLDSLSDGMKEGEPQLRASFERLGLPFPPPARWRELRDELGAATVGTFHSLCSQLLRRAPPGARVRTGFELLEEREASSLLSDVVERALLQRMEHGSPLRSLVAEIGFGRFVESLMPIASRIREEGITPDFVHVADGPSLRARFDTELRGLRFRTRSVQPSTAKQIDQLNRIRLLSDAATFETFEHDGEELARASARITGQVGELREVIEALRQIWVACHLAPQEAEVRELLTDIFTAHDEALMHRGVLDFTGLLIEARNLLRDSHEARQEAHARIGALLVDEFQDTNRLQLELVLLLSEKRTGAPRPISVAFEQQHQEIVVLPQQPGFLAVVGDRKQSIYEFRGADVSVFEIMARAIERSDGQRAFLQSSRRSTPALLKTLNAGFAHVLRAAEDKAPADFEVIWNDAHDALFAVRKDDTPGEAVQQLTDPRVPPKATAEELRLADAEAIASTLAHALRGQSPLLLAESGTPARGGDIAMLFQRFTQLETYRQALVRHGVRHRVVRGRGFFGAQEVLDVASLLSLLADPGDAIALSAVVRSPMVGLTDAEWVALAKPANPSLHQRWALDARAVLLGRQPVSPALARFREQYSVLREARDRLGLRALLRIAYDEFQLRVAVAAGPFGEQALANLDKLLTLASAREKQGMSVAQFGAELAALADEAPREAQADVVDELDPDAVTLCTVHQAKGLEWPIVVLPDLSVTPRNETGAVRFDREHGLGIARPRGESEIKSLSAKAITDQLTRRARAEHARLLYVAMTRARDRILLGLRPPQPRVNTWAHELSFFFPLQLAGDVAWQLDVSRFSALPAAQPPPTQTQADVEGVLEAVRGPRRSSSRALVLPVTQLQDHASCPRRFHLVHQIGLAERPASDSAAAGETPDVGEARERGIAVHKLLELTPLELIGAPPARLKTTLKQLRRAEGLERLVTDDVLAWIERFWRSAFVHGLSTATEIHRELPFALRIDHPTHPGLVLRGQIDLLVVTKEELIVVDYKTTVAPPSGLDPWRAQLASYAVAARRLSGRSLPVRAGIAFLREESPEPRFLPTLDFPQLEATLIDEAAALDASQRAASWEGRPRSVCESIGCGYVYRCHP